MQLGEQELRRGHTGGRHHRHVFVVLLGVAGSVCELPRVSGPRRAGVWYGHWVAQRAEWSVDHEGPRPELLVSDVLEHVRGRVDGVDLLIAHALGGHVDGDAPSVFRHVCPQDVLRGQVYVAERVEDCAPFYLFSVGGLGTLPGAPGPRAAARVVRWMVVGPQSLHQRRPEAVERVEDLR